MPLVGQRTATIQVVEPLPVPKAAVQLEIRFADIQGQRIGRIGLQLHGVGTGSSHRPQCFPGYIQAPTMVGRQFRHNLYFIHICYICRKFNHSASNSLALPISYFRFLRQGNRTKCVSCPMASSLICNPGYLSLNLPEIRCCLSNNYYRTLTDLITKTVQ